MIPAALAALTEYRQFIVYKRAPLPTGKTTKLPVDWRTLSVADAHNPAVWLGYHDAEALAAMYGDPYGLGFVLTDRDPFWFLDIDNCRTDAGWSDTAMQLCQALAGAAVEVSQSGRGLHVIGRGTVPAHGCRNIAAGLELYHSARFVALGDWRTPPAGDAGHDCTTALAAVVAQWFSPASSSNARPAEWTDGPAEGAGAAGVNDDELIARARASTGAASAFGHGASFDALWTADAAALGAAFPDPAREYDASAADAALAMRLLFWTGRDCERTRRLMERSALAREKWGREDYLPRTIMGGMTRGSGEYWKGATRPADTATRPADTSAAPLVRSLATARPVDGSVILGVDGQIALFAGHTYVRDGHVIACPDGMLATRERFDSWLGGWQFVLDSTNTKLSSSAWEAFTASRLYRFPKVHSMAFRPALPPGAIWEQGGVDYVNTYFPVVTARQAGDPAPFLDLLKRMLPVKLDRDILLAYMAFCVQYPGVKAQWCVLLQGTQGNGKSFIGECLIEAIGRRYCHSPKAAELTGKFNAWVYGKLLAVVEDMHTPHTRQQADVIEVLKPMITASYLEIEAKGQDKRTAEVCLNFVLNSNHKDAIRKTQDDRRFAVFYGAQQSETDLARDGMDGDYFPRLYDWARAGGYAVINDYLRSYEIPDALNPARSCHRAPATSSTAEACRASAGPIEQEVQDAIEQGRVGFRGGWISTHYMDALLREIGAERLLPRNKRRDLLTGMGYIPHPGLAATEGRVNNTVAPEGTKPRLYIRDGHPAAAISEPARVAQAYTDAQGEPGAVSPVTRVPPAVLAFPQAKKAPTG